MLCAVLLSAYFSVSLVLLLGFPYFVGDFLFAVSVLCLIFSPPFSFSLLFRWFSSFVWKCNLRVIFILSFFLLTSPLLFFSSFSLTFHGLLLWALSEEGEGEVEGAVEVEYCEIIHVSLQNIRRKCYTTSVQLVSMQYCGSISILAKR